jgi:uncharacterized protein (UPF0335 family)
MESLHEDGKPTGEFDKMFDLDRSTLTKSFVDRMEECLRQQQVAADDLKQVCADATEAEFGPHDIKAMKKIARIWLKDQRSDARDQLEALERIGRAVQFELFDWDERIADVKH